MTTFTQEHAQTAVRVSDVSDEKEETHENDGCHSISIRIVYDAIALGNDPSG